MELLGGIFNDMFRDFRLVKHGQTDMTNVNSYLQARRKLLRRVIQIVCFFFARL